MSDMPQTCPTCRQTPRIESKGSVTIACPGKHPCRKVTALTVANAVLTWNFLANKARPHDSALANTVGPRHYP